MSLLTGILYLCLASLPAEAAFWDVEPVYTGGFAAGDASLAISSGNVPAVTFTAYGNLYYSTKTVGGWSPELVAEVGYWGGWSSLVFGTGDLPCVAFIDATDPEANYLKYAYRGTSGWTVETVDDVGWLPDFVSLALDSGGRACVAYCRTAGSYPDTHTFVRIARRTAPSTWTKQDIVEVGGVTGTSMVFEADGTARVVFRDSGTGCIKLASQTGSDPWQVSVIDGSTSIPAVGYPSIALQPSGRPAVAYFTNNAGTVYLNYAAWEGAAWRKEACATLVSGGEYHCSVAVTAGGIPMIGYHDAGGETFRDAWRVGGMWLTETVDPAPRTGMSPRMKLDTLGNVEAAYVDDLNGHIKFASALVPTSVKAAKTSPDGATVQLSGVVSSSAGGELGNQVYVQQLDRSCGIQLCFTTGVPTVARGSLLDIQGAMSTVGEERTIVDPDVVLLTSADPPRPLSMRNATAGGGDFHYVPSSPASGQRGVTGGRGLNNTGLLIRTWGRVMSVGADYFVVDDGSDVQLKCHAPGLSMPGLGSYVSLTGISSCEPANSDLIRLLRVRSSDDIVTHTD